MDVITYQCYDGFLFQADSVVNPKQQFLILNTQVLPNVDWANKNDCLGSAGNHYS